MCGIVGRIDRTLQADDWKGQLRKMTDCIPHRGPDDEGIWYDVQHGVGLGHRRLSIIDTSTAGAQPMQSPDGQLVIVYNGEVYNFRELKQELAHRGHSFQSHTDTEVILAAVQEWGVERAVRRFNGMFAFALWDQRERCLSLVRDRVGIKPLYYGRVNSGILFGSELKSFRAARGFDPVVDRNALALYFRHNYIPAPHAIYEGVWKLPPGCMLRIESQNSGHGVLPDPQPYWELEQVVQRGQDNMFRGSDKEAVSELDELLRDATDRRMIADVPLGAFLSGGIDSSTVVALMQAQSHQPVKTFSIGFNQSEYNEATHAKAVAERLGTDHTEMYVKSQEARDVIPKLPHLYDEPFADSSQIPTYLVSKLAREQVTVSLSGDGGDELFGGYRRYATGRDLWAQISRIPEWGRRGLGAVLRNTPSSVWDLGFNWMNPHLEQYGRPGTVSDKLQKAGEVLALAGQRELYGRLTSHWKRPEHLVRNWAGSPKLDEVPKTLHDFTHYMMYMDAKKYLPDDILVKVDRASMGVSLEARVPLLDHRVVEHAWRLPLHLKVRDGQEKWILRQVLHKYVPKELFDRPKMGFGVPIGHWIRGPLRGWAESLLEETRLREEGYLNPRPIREKWKEHVQGHADWKYHLWDVLMFQAWLEHQ
jgi:asparagine synthase (glutamine-hydrolysing)